MRRRAMRRLMILASLALTILLVLAGWQLYFMISAYLSSPPQQADPLSENGMRPAQLPRR
jgi:hypothetical protein